MFKFKVGDNIKVTAGKDKGRTGKIEFLSQKESGVILSGINIVKKHVKGRPGQKGGIFDVPKPLNAGKVALVCPKCSKVTRVGIKIVDGKKVRFCKKCKREIDTK